MKLGYSNRRAYNKFRKLIRQIFHFFLYTGWVLFDFSKFKRIKNINSILVVWEGKTIGDLYHALGMLNRFNTLYPDVKVYFLCGEGRKNFVKNININVITRNEIKNKKIDAIFLFSYLERRFYKDIRYSIGFRNVGMREFLKKRMRLTRMIYPYKDSEPGVSRMFKCFKAAGFDLKDKFEFYYTKEAEAYAKKFYKKLKRPVIFVHLGAKDFSPKNTSNKSWRIDNWVEVINKLIELYNPAILMTGSKEEENAINRVISLINKKNLKRIVNYPIETVASLMKRGDLLISVDTGLVHVAAQSGIPIVDLYRWDCKRGWPWTEKKSMLFHPEVCNDCERYDCPEGEPICINSITPKEVLREAKRWLKN